MLLKGTVLSSRWCRELTQRTAWTCRINSCSPTSPYFSVLPEVVAGVPLSYLGRRIHWLLLFNGCGEVLSPMQSVRHYRHILTIHPPTPHSSSTIVDRIRFSDLLPSQTDKSLPRDRRNPCHSLTPGRNRLVWVLPGFGGKFPIQVLLGSRRG